MQIIDQIGQTLNIKTTPKRIVSLVPSQTELLVDLGLETSIVGITKFCVHPNHLRKQKVIVGGTKTIHIDKIEALKPDIILCNKEENTKEIVDACRAICPVHVSDIYNFEDCILLFRQYGELFNVSEKAESIITSLQRERQSFLHSKINLVNKRVAYMIWQKPYMVAGSNTFINFIINDIGLVNVYEKLKRYPEVTLEELQNSEIDNLLLSSEPFPFSNEHKIKFEETLKTTKVILVDGEYFSWYGSRLLGAYRYFKEVLGMISDD